MGMERLVNRVLQGGEKSMSKKWRLNVEDWKKIGKNALVFSAPALAIFFYQLSQGVELKKALWVAIFVAYGLLADLFKKLAAGK